MKILFSLISSLLIVSFINSQALDELEEIQSLKLLEDTKVVGCWLKAYGRGVGVPITSCNNPSEEKSGLLCYPKCEKGFSGIGPVCWLDCPSDFHDDGAFCFKPKPYGRGVGYAYWNKNECAQENKQGCEKWGLMNYPKCMDNFHNVACCICSPNCPKDMTDIGISCAKKSYGRGAGTPLECAAGLEYDAGLCYTKCNDGWKNVGPVCWGGCPKDYTPCGAACLKDQSCAGQIKQYFQGVADIAESVDKGNVAGTIVNVAKYAQEYIFDICP